MNDVLTLGEIEARFPSEWVLIGDPQTDESQHLLSGTVLFHSTNRDEVDRKLLGVAPAEVRIPLSRIAARGHGVDPMNYPFTASHGPIIVEGSLSGPMGQADVRLILDTGATTSLVRTPILIAVGYDPDTSPDRVSVAMGNGIEVLPRLVLNRFSTLGRHRLGFRVVVTPTTSGRRR